jgi:hypothetical protein
VIEAARPMAASERIEPERPPYLDVMRCSRCGNALGRVYLTVGSWVEQRCHHVIERPDPDSPTGKKRKVCGWVNTIRPTR